MIELKDLNIFYNNKVLIKDGEAKFYKSKVHLIIGKSGSGKSTFLYRIGLISGDAHYKYFIDNENILLKSELEKSYLKRFNISYVLQDNSLFEQYDVLGNLKLYSEFIQSEYTIEDLVSILEIVHLDVPFNQKISTLSGGEKQRLAIACALCKKADIYILDEPTESLDENNAKIIFDVLRDLAHKYNKCIILSSHSVVAKDYADIVYKIENSQLVHFGHANDKQNLSLSQQRKKRRLRLEFYINYIKYFQLKFRNLNKLIISIMTLTILASLFSVNIINFYIDKNKETIISTGTNQLFITDSKTNIFVDDLSHPVENAMIQKIIGEEECFFSSPYVQLNTIFLEKEVVILPYYDENDFSNLELCKLDTRNNKGLYLSYNML